VMAAEGIAHVDVDIARRLLGGVRLRLSPVCGGRNSRVYRVDSSGDGIFALKRYLPLENDGRDRLGVETSALRWMASHGLDMVPRVMAVDVETGSVLLSWMGGSRPNELRPGDVDQVIEFLRVLERLRRTAPLRGARLASEACLSGKELERQIRKRLSDLAALDDEPALRTFLREEFIGVFEIFLDRARRVLLSSELSFEAELRPENQSLVPSDFGFHNALRDDLGRLAFVDFEDFFRSRYWTVFAIETRSWVVTRRPERCLAWRPRPAHSGTVCRSALAWRSRRASRSVTAESS